MDDDDDDDGGGYNGDDKDNDNLCISCTSGLCTQRAIASNRYVFNEHLKLPMKMSCDCKYDGDDDDDDVQWFNVHLKAD